MFSRRFVLLQWSLALLLTASFVLAQSAPGETLLDPQATCPQETRDSITTCLGQVEVDESQRPGGPCNDGDWPCICNKQYGLIACYAPCPGIQPAEDVTYNNNNCAGQHNGVRNGAAGGPATYSGAALTTTAPNGATGTAGSAGGATATTEPGASSASNSSAPNATSTGSSSSTSTSTSSPAVNSTSTSTRAGSGDGALSSLHFGSAQIGTVLAMCLASLIGAIFVL